MARFWVCFRLMERSRVNWISRTASRWIAAAPSMSRRSRIGGCRNLSNEHENKTDIFGVRTAGNRSGAGGVQILERRGIEGICENPGAQDQRAEDCHRTGGGVWRSLRDGGASGRKRRGRAA